MRFPTLAGLTAGTQRVFARYPETMLTAVVAALLAVVTIRHSAHVTWPAWWAATSLGISAFFSVTMAAESWTPAGGARFSKTRLSLALLTAAGVIAVALAWPRWSASVQVHRLIHLALACHLLASFAPFLGRHRPNAFWQYNRTLFVRFLVGALYSTVLFAGIAIAIAAAKPLFGLNVHERTYFDLWFIIAFVFNTGYFLAGVPDDFDALEQDPTYPVGLKIFAQFILVPLVALYLVILTTYLVKVLVTGQWPNGWIGWLVSSVSAAGLLAILLVHPVRDREENRWVGTFTRAFHLALLPSIAMLFAAIGKRIGQYGFTEERYYLLALALWITGIAIGYTFRRRADIRWIPITLFVLAAVTAFGPWGAYSLSRIDQTRRLVRLLARQSLMVDGVIHPTRSSLPFPEQKQLSSLLDYVAGTHGVAALPKPLRALAETDSTFKSGEPGAYDQVGYRGTLAAQAIMRQLGVAYVPKWQSGEDAPLSFFSPPRAGAVQDIADFEQVVTIEGAMPQAFRVGDREGRLELPLGSRQLRLSDGSGGVWTFSLDSAVVELRRNGFNSPPGGRAEPLQLDAVSLGRPARLRLHSLSTQVSGDSLRYLSVSGQLYLRGWGAAGSR